MLIVVLTFLLGLIFLVFYTNKFVIFSKNVAYKLKISPLIIGITVLAIATSLPEMAVSLISAASGDYGLALGNIIGSNITNVLLVLPVAILMGKLRIGTTKTQKTIIAVVTISLIYFLIHILRIPVIYSSIFLLSITVLVTIFEYVWGIEGSEKEDAKMLQSSTNDIKISFKYVISSLANLLGMTVGGYVLYISVKNLSSLLGYSTTVLGLSLTAIATSFPELLATIFTQNEHEEKMAFGNILGSNIYNITLIGGLSVLFSKMVIISVNDWLWFIGSVLVTLIIVKVYSGRVIPKWIGIFLISLMVTYLVSLYLIK